jgi:hypothetical protein
MKTYRKLSVAFSYFLAEVVMALILTTMNRIMADAGFIYRIGNIFLFIVVALILLVNFWRSFNFSKNWIAKILIGTVIAYTFWGISLAAFFVFNSKMSRIPPSAEMILASILVFISLLLCVKSVKTVKI